MKKAIILLIIMLTGISSIFSGCIQSGSGVLVLQITDAPSDLNISKALVNISTVQVHKADFGVDDNDSDAGWFTIVSKSQTFDLIQLIDVKEVFDEEELSAGWYTQIRLVVERALVTIDGVEYNLSIPSKNVKLISPFEIVANETTTLTLDFDVHESIHKTGNDKYIMNPMIKVIHE
ncbi:DUF4382 domain-containing protein [Thermoplasmatota archaeon]